jgi:hypothetical protein
VEDWGLCEPDVPNIGPAEEPVVSACIREGEGMRVSYGSYL